jgi:nucleoside phosphorylase
MAPTAPTAPTAIVAPLAAELAGVLAATGERRRLRVRVRERSERAEPSESGPPRRWPGRRRRSGWTWKVTFGRLAGEEVALMATGDGPAAAAAGLAALLAAARPCRLLVIGVAGGLTPGLAEGTLVAARQVISGDGSAAPRGPDAAWLAAALAAGAVAGTVISADRILADPAARQTLLGEALPAATMPAAAMPAPPLAAVDLESMAYARVAAAWSLPYLVVRAILDPAGEELPLDFEACRDGSGRVSNARVVWRALARPRSLAKLWRLRARVRAAAGELAALATVLIGLPAASAAPAVPAALAVPADLDPPREAGPIPGARLAGSTGGSKAVDERREIPAAAAGRRSA